ncbi:excalibur calcium-binding domain-containing protein [Tenggerimyces flavus]|uniref:Excalibur calcium-binding domain-containing protein n=1 Tax=Tenggerimyces flavus TaxID=1708749 RepID=A0ABV7YBS0_9ACTN|nr:excalibur calcium-binding domain-containing protein [Tenggerimyces flavus]MBM7787072.1 hypothetical protein [Tenggerimyces flavus]
MPSFDPPDSADDPPDVSVDRQVSRPDGHQSRTKVALRTGPILAGVAALLTTIAVGVGAQVASSDDLDPKFRSCAEAKSHGYGSYRDGEDVEYGWYRDADEDGIVCD